MVRATTCGPACDLRRALGSGIVWAMRTYLSLLVFVATAAAPVLAQLPALRVPTCVAVTVVSRSDGIGFTHVMRVVNGCDREIGCSLGTEGAPGTVHVRVLPGATSDTPLAAASPVASLTPIGTCEPY